MFQPIVEIAVDNLPDALSAFEAGADRIELCDSLASHGLSALPRVLADCRLVTTQPIAAMVRPRTGGFVASPSDHVLAPRQAQSLLAVGADAVVFGFLTSQNTIDPQLCTRLVRAAGAAQTVFHRAFDLIPDPLAAIDQLVELGVTRILTSGMSPKAAAHALGLPAGPVLADPLDARLLNIRRYIDRAAGRIEILPCGGIRADNARRFLTDTGATQLHSACRAEKPQLDAYQVRRLVAAVRNP